MKHPILLTLLICYTCTTFAQKNPLTDLPISISYFGETGIHPGLKVGIEQAIFSSTKEKKYLFKKRQEKYGPKVKHRELYALHGIGFYHHSKNHLGAFLGSELGFRRIKNRKGRMLGISLGVGYLHRFYHLDTYELNDQGDVERIAVAGKGSLMITAYGMFGRDLSINKNIPIKWFVKPGLQFADYNNYYLPNAILELGVVLKPWKRK